MGNKIQRIYIGSNLVRPKWKPGANTVGYYTFADQSTSQITDFSGKGNNIPWNRGNYLTFSQLSGGDYYGIFNSSYYQQDNQFNLNNWTVLFYCKLSTTAKQYLMWTNVIDIIYGFNSGQIELYRFSGSIYRTTLKSSTPQNTWMLIGYTKNGSTITTYYNGTKVGTATFPNETLTKIEFGGSSNEPNKSSMDNIILEDRIWTDDDFLKYYNLTKSNYGL